jgi:hypothetical protein
MQVCNIKVKCNLYDVFKGELLNKRTQDQILSLSVGCLTFMNATVNILRGEKVNYHYYNYFFIIFLNACLISESIILVLFCLKLSTLRRTKCSC